MWDGPAWRQRGIISDVRVTDCDRRGHSTTLRGRTDGARGGATVWRRGWMVEFGRACVHASDSPGMAINQLIIVRRGCEGRYRSLQDTFGVEPLSATVVWDRRQRDQRVRAHAAGVDRRRTDRRGAEPSSWSALDFLVAGANNGAATRRSTRSVDGDVLPLREVRTDGPCSVSTVP